MNSAWRGLPISPWAHWWRRVLPAYWVFLFCVTHFPKLQLDAPPGSDKVVHIGAYAVLAFLVWQFSATFGPLSRSFAPRAAAGLLVYAAFDELTQPLVGRGADLWDWLADGLGILLVLVPAELWRRHRARVVAGEAPR